MLVTGRSFQYSILAATLLPLVVVSLMQLAPGTAGTSLSTIFTWLATLSGTHVAATAYLLFNPREHIGVFAPLVTLLVIPVLLFAANMFVLLAMPLTVVMLFMLAYIHYGMWHFGRQNLGVLAFVTRFSVGRPMTPFERWTIMAGVVAGICAGYSIFKPQLMLTPKAFPFDLTLIDPFFSALWYVGAAIYAVLVPLVIWYVVTERRTFDAATLATYAAAAFFFLPVFLSNNPMFTLAAWSTAHGLQYLVFLVFHAGGKTRPIVPIAFFASAVVAGYAIWQTSANLQGSEDLFTVKVAIAVITGLTLVHYWVDQFLWRFNSPERRAWLAQNYAFLVPRSGAQQPRGKTATSPTSP